MSKCYTCVNARRNHPSDLLCWKRAQIEGWEPCEGGKLWKEYKRCINE